MLLFIELVKLVIVICEYVWLVCLFSSWFSDLCVVGVSVVWLVVNSVLFDRFMCLIMVVVGLVVEVVLVGVVLYWKISVVGLDLLCSVWVEFMVCMGLLV